MEYLSQLVTSEDTIESWKIKRTDILRRILDIVGESPVKKVPPEPELIDEVECGNYLRRKIIYSVDPDERISAYLMIPKGITKPVPAILCAHGTGREGKDIPVGIAIPRPNRAYAHELAQHGYVTFSIDDLVMGERGKAKGVKGYSTDEFYKNSGWCSTMAKMIWDYGCGLDYLNTLDYVDCSRIGSIGHSLGATTTLFLAAFDQRIKVAVVSCGVGCFIGNPLKLNYVREAGKGLYSYFPKLRPIFLADKPVPFDIHEVISLIAPRALLRLSAYNDIYVRRADIIAESSYRANEVYKLLGAEKNFAQHFHGDGHDFYPAIRALAYSWFDEYLK